jgi:hypothetical protein
MMRKKLKVAAIVAGVLILMLIISHQGGEVAASQAECGGYIDYDQPVYDTVPYAGDCRYYFTGYSGYTVTISMIKKKDSYSLDPYLELLDPNGDLEAVDDDSAGNSNSLIDDHTLSYSGTYTIIAGSYGNQSAGSFTLSLSQ